MPFTVSHSVAILPLQRYLRPYIIFSALIIGSMIPDIDHFIPLFYLNIFTHTIPGIFSAAVPLGLLFFWIFQHHLKRPAIYLMPRYLQSRLGQFEAPLSLRKNFFKVIFSLMLGAFTHILWDGFTHINGIGVKLFPMLKYSVFQISGYDGTIYKILQHGGSIAGLLILAHSMMSWLKVQQPKPLRQQFHLSDKKKGLFWLGISLFSLLTGLAVAFYFNGFPEEYNHFRLFTRSYVLGTMASFGVLYLLIGFSWKLLPISATSRLPNKKR